MAEVPGGAKSSPHAVLPWVSGFASLALHLLGQCAGSLSGPSPRSQASLSQMW